MEHGLNRQKSDNRQNKAMMNNFTGKTIKREFSEVENKSQRFVEHINE